MLCDRSFCFPTLHKSGDKVLQRWRVLAFCRIAPCLNVIWLNMRKQEQQTRDAKSKWLIFWVALIFSSWERPKRLFSQGMKSLCQGAHESGFQFIKFKSLYKLTESGYSKSFTKPKSSPLASKLPSLERQVAFTSVTSLPGGKTPLTVGPKTQVNVDHCNLSTSGTLMVFRFPEGAS